MYIFAIWGLKPDDVSTSFPFCGCGCVFLGVDPLDLKALSILSNDSLLDDKADNLRLIGASICLMTVGGWLNSVLM